jgi:hypothetical protein
VKLLVLKILNGKINQDSCIRISLIGNVNIIEEFNIYPTRVKLTILFAISSLYKDIGRLQIYPALIIISFWRLNS